jgi:uncharacterized protein
VPETAPQFGDPTTAGFWEAASRRELVVQQCQKCGEHQFYPRPFCLHCNGTELKLVNVTGRGTVYALTTVHLKVHPDLEPPYAVAVVELDEGPRFVSQIVDGTAAIGDAVELAWRERPDKPPLPVFRPTGRSL